VNLDTSQPRNQLRRARNNHLIFQMNYKIIIVKVLLNMIMKVLLSIILLIMTMNFKIMNMNLYKCKIIKQNCKKNSQ
jgi:hypothetical protein